MVTGKRRLKDWLDSFVKFTEKRPTHDLFRRWVAISIIAAVLERKVWVHTLGMDLYPNLFVILVSPPGGGKTVLTEMAHRFWADLKEHYIAPSSVSRASLIDALREAERRIVQPDKEPPILFFNSLYIALNELGTMISVYDNEFMTTLTDLYDNKQYGERKRTRDLNFVIKAPQINLLAGTQPSYLMNTLPEGAWDQGFTSRSLFIYAGEPEPQDLFGESALSDKLYQDLLNDLKVIGDLSGKITFTPEAAKAIGAWHNAKGPPRPDHPKLTYYNVRRSVHLLKLCQVASVLRGSDLKVSEADAARALSWLLEAEMYMPDIFKAMAQGGDSKVIEDTWYYAYTVYIRDKKLLSEERIIEFIAARTPAHNVDRIFQLMMRLKLFEKELNEYRPRAPVRK